MTTTVRRQLDVAGVVQGVGFRPFVYQVALDLGLVGFVRNETTHVHIEIEGPADSVEHFEHHLRNHPPVMARIDSINSASLSCATETAFRIAPSRESQTGRHQIAVGPDIAVCAECTAELFDPADRRFRYPFITCSHCGPRFTITTAMPYDRSNTTMSHFAMCAQCALEYSDPSDRRHHAQPLACENCGPKISYVGHGSPITGTDGTLARVLEDLAMGQIVAIKGLGGYHLAVDATNDEAVRRLRERKARRDKPFAIMVADLEAARLVGQVGAAEAGALHSPARPIVLLRSVPGSIISPAVTEGNPLIGLVLPYTPLHHLLFRPVPQHDVAVPKALVLTSGNLAGEPICYEDEDARNRLGAVADSFCSHDRPISVPCDDSVTRMRDGAEFPIRRSRGFAPLPMALPTSVPPILAVGGEIKNTFALATGQTAWMSQHLGDMENLETVLAFESSVELLSQLYQIHPEILAVDAHPGYRTRRWAYENSRGRPVIEVQHHHAHLASLMAEHQLDESASVIGFVFDGTGYGYDGSLWGGEILVGGYRAVQRWGHLKGVQLPGGDSAVRNPCRTALAHLAAAGIEWSEDLPPVQACGDTERSILSRQLGVGTSCSESSSMGRLFDAVASILGVRHRITYEAQAAIELEALALTAATGSEMTLLPNPDGTLDTGPLLAALAQGVKAGVDPGSLALGFHRAVVEAIVACATKIRSNSAINLVGLTGGVFQNVLLTSLAAQRLATEDFEVLTHSIVPANDGGLALGQLMVAAHQKHNGIESETPCA